MKIFACLYYPFPNFRMSTQSEIRKKKTKPTLQGNMTAIFLKSGKEDTGNCRPVILVRTQGGSLGQQC